MDFLRKILFKFSKFSRTQKQSLLLVVDFLVLDISLYLSFMLRFEELYPQKFINQDIWLFILLPIVTIPFFVILGLYGISNGLTNLLGSSTWAEIYGVQYIGSIKALSTA